MLKRITLLKERVEDWKSYPFSVPTIASLTEIEITSRIVFFAGENGTGKSTLLEAIASHYGFGPEGGNRNLQHDTTEHNHSTDNLVRALRLSFDKRTGAGFSSRAISRHPLLVRRKIENGAKEKIHCQMNHSIAHIPSQIFVLPLSARKSHVKPRKHLTSYKSATCTWHFSYHHPAILEK